ncbi:MAG: UPF0262 family protein [Proteobacteria bacterium]|nr:UPF0262 family protein [Pseudomonadota bacterium]MDA1072271.1 UPF0262 family protein [Pseudomonadota bacterium]
MVAAAERISDIRLDDRLIKRRSPEIEHEMGVAIYDLLETNRFVPADAPPGPYHVLLAIRDGRTLVFEIMDEKDQPLSEVPVGLSAFRRIVKDYFTVCESYFEAIRHAPASRIEALDMGRRGLHNEGAVLLQESLEGKIEIDEETARRLFTLICVLHIRA